MMKIVACIECGFQYNYETRRDCPKCGSTGWKLADKAAMTGDDEDNSLFFNPSEKPTSYVRGSVYESTKYEATMNDLVAAQNRTTHAIRAFVRFLFIQLSATTLAAFIYSLANSNINPTECATNGTHCSANTGLVLLAALIWIVGVVISSSVGWSELEASNIPGE